MKRMIFFGALLALGACGPKGGKTITGKKCEVGDLKCQAEVPDNRCLPGDPCYKEPACEKDDKGNCKEPVLDVDAKKDFYAAVEAYQKYDAEGWNASACQASAEKFAAVAREHKFVEAMYMVGRSFHNCNMLEDAEKAYNGALSIKADHAPSISNLGELYYQTGRREAAKKYWESAVTADPKIAAARANLAMLLLEDLRTTKDADKWKKMEQEARDHLSSVLAVDNDHIKAYVLYGLVYMEGREKNKNRLDLAKLLLDEGSKRLKEGQKFAPIEHAYGLYYLYKNNLTQAMEKFQAAVNIDPSFTEARQNVALIYLGFRKYAEAMENFTKVLELQDYKNYDALIGLGIAQRGTKDLDGAEASYNKAKALDNKRGEAPFNLGVLYKDFRLNDAADSKAALEVLKTARQYFKDAQGLTLTDADRDEAKENIADCDKNIKVYEEAAKAAAAGGG